MDIETAKLMAPLTGLGAADAASADAIAGRTRPVSDDHRHEPAARTAAAQIEPEPDPSAGKGEGWNCGNGALRARAILRFIDANPATANSDLIQTLDELLYEAGAAATSRFALGSIPF